MQLTKEYIESLYKSKCRENWYDYANESNNCGVTPPAGAVCIYQNHGDWTPCLFIGFNMCGSFVIQDAESGDLIIGDAETICFRAINYRHIAEMDKKWRAVSEASKIFHANCMHDYSGQPFIDGLMALYDAGMLKSN